MISVDPRPIPTIAIAEGEAGKNKLLHIDIRPGTDIALLDGLFAYAAGGLETLCSPAARARLRAGAAGWRGGGFGMHRTAETRGRRSFWLLRIISIYI
jgi:hypothetical protein